MKVLTLTQPWATLIAIGAKQYETRSWATTWRGPLAIHAAKRFPRVARGVCFQPPFQQALQQAGYTSFARARLHNNQLPLGHIIAVCQLVHCVPSEARPQGIGEQELAFGDYSAGRFIWYLRNVRPLPEPIPARGSLGLWTFEHPALDARATLDDARMA